MNEKIISAEKLYKILHYSKRKTKYLLDGFRMKKVSHKQAERLTKNYPDALGVGDVASILKCVPKTVLKILATGEKAGFCPLVVRMRLY